MPFLFHYDKFLNFSFYAKSQIHVTETSGDRQINQQCFSRGLCAHELLKYDNVNSVNIANAILCETEFKLTQEVISQF